MAESVIAVVGPTAAGKSELAVRLSLEIGGEIINADSMQLYAGMDIGTAKLPVAQRRGVPHHLLDVWDVKQTASVAEYQRLARDAIADIQRRGLVPVLAGGSVPGNSSGSRAARTYSPDPPASTGTRPRRWMSAMACRARR